jgi:hypothetical protein
VTPIADMVERMLAESAPATAIIAAVRAMESVTLRHVMGDVTRHAASRDGSREKAAARARRYRKNKRIQQVAKANDVAASGVTVTLETVTRNVTEPNLSNVSTIKEGLSIEGSKKDRLSSARARGTRLAPGAPLSDEHRALITAEGIHDPARLWAEFVDYWSDIPGQRGTKVSWSGTLRNRCRDVIKRGFNGNGNSPIRTNPASQQSGSAPVFAGVAAATERRARERSAAGQQRPVQQDPDPPSRDDSDLFRADGGATAHR